MGEQVFAQAAPATAKPAAADPAAAKPAAAKAGGRKAGGAAGAGHSAPVAPAPGTKPATAPAKPATAPKTDTSKGEPKEEPPPAPENFFLRTKDGWNIFCTFYGPKKGVRSGKLVVPIIMLHGWGGQGSEYAELATVLQSWGFASIVPDLRGHGRSVSVVRRKPNGEEEDKVVKTDDLTAPDMDGMVNDVEALKKVLVDKNNKAELNIEMLTVVAAEVGTIVAMNWAALDWSWPVMPSFKQGQDVKALVLLTPQQTFKRMNANTALNSPSDQPPPVDLDCGGRPASSRFQRSETDPQSPGTFASGRGSGRTPAEAGFVLQPGPDTTAGHQASRPGLAGGRQHHEIPRFAAAAETGGLSLDGT